MLFQIIQRSASVLSQPHLSLSLYLSLPPSLLPPPPTTITQPPSTLERWAGGSAVRRSVGTGPRGSRAATQLMTLWAKGEPLSCCWGPVVVDIGGTSKWESVITRLHHSFVHKSDKTSTTQLIFFFFLSIVFILKSRVHSLYIELVIFHFLPPIPTQNKSNKSHCLNCQKVLVVLHKSENSVGGNTVKQKPEMSLRHLKNKTKKTSKTTEMAYESNERVFNLLKYWIIGPQRELDFLQF